MDLGITGRVAVVTGASIGLGHAIARAMAAEGVHVVAVARRGDLLADLVSTITQAGGPRALAIEADVTARDTPSRVREQALEAFGQVDILVNNAGGSRPTTWDAPDEVWEESMTLNFHAGRRLAQALVPDMRAAGWGRIVNVTGSSEPRDVNAASPAKAAVHAWAKGLSRMVAAGGITVNCIPPGRIDSEQVRERLHPTPESREAYIAEHVPAGRFGTPEELAALAVFLASEPARYITGQLVHVDGGTRRFAF